MKLTNEEGRQIIFDDHEDWKSVEEEEIVDTRRWSVTLTQVFQHIPSGKHYQLCWSQGATEEQDERPFEYDTPEPEEVVQKEILVKTWVPANE